ncbi:MAG: sigma-54-dependent transcriptional regulator [Pseudomonadota bacterium]
MNSNNNSGNTHQGHALVVDDEPDLRELVSLTLSRMNIRVSAAESLAGAKQKLATNDFDLCFTDMQLGDGNGLELVRYVQKNCPGTPVAVITAFGSMETAILALKEGAFDFVAKPVDLQRLRDLTQSALRLRQRSTGPRGDDVQRELVGDSAPMQRLRSQVRKLARSQAPVYISGESGTGKEMVARLVHRLGPRADNPFVPVNCGAIPSELMESEFFGHKKGSFTGATTDREGLFQSANGGTLFLDEIADLPLSMQVKLLRAIQEKSVRPIGSEREIRVDVRILSATHKDLQREVDAGRFRQDLFYRINVIQLDVPPLRERSEDVLILAEHFLEQLAREWHIETPVLLPDARSALAQYRFPGNVRELENILERAVTLSDDNRIGAAHLRLGESSPESSSLLPPEGERPAQLPGETLEDYLQRIEKDMILKALHETRWNRTAAARKLGMTFRSLRYRLQKLGLDAGSDDGN